MPNMASHIKSHNSKIADNHQTPSNANASAAKKTCNCRNKTKCPLDGNCLTPNVIYQAEVHNISNGNKKIYIGLTELPFKLRFYNHTQSFKKKKHRKDTELSQHVWKLKRRRKPFRIKWSIIGRARGYSNVTKRCNLCIAEKLHIMNADKRTLLNSRNELVSKCRHENKFRLSNFSI